jgi:leucyl-tRNA synthetase
MKQWLLRITAYAERLLRTSTSSTGPRASRLQRNWIGRSTGAEVDFRSSASCASEVPAAPRR